MDDSVVRAVLRRFGLPDAEPQRVAREGLANATWYCGRFVVRVGKDPEYEEDARTESVAAPAAYAAGVLTPRPVGFDFSRELADAPVSVFERAPGMPVALAPAPVDPGTFWRSLGREVRRLHDRVRAVEDPLGLLDDAWLVDPMELAEAASDREVRSLALDLAAAPVPESYVFAHQDLHLDNLLIDGDRLSALIDWGDAGWGEPACDLRHVPPAWVPAALEGYDRCDPEFLARLALHLLDEHVQNADEPCAPARWGELERLVRSWRLG